MKQAYILGLIILALMGLVIVSTGAITNVSQFPDEPQCEKAKDAKEAQGFNCEKCEPYDTGYYKDGYKLKCTSEDDDFLEKLGMKETRVCYPTTKTQAKYYDMYAACVQKLRRLEADADNAILSACVAQEKPGTVSSTWDWEGELSSTQDNPCYMREDTWGEKIMHFITFNYYKNKAEEEACNVVMAQKDDQQPATVRTEYKLRWEHTYEVCADASGVRTADTSERSANIDIKCSSDNKKVEITLDGELLESRSCGSGFCKIKSGAAGCHYETVRTVSLVDTITDVAEGSSELDGTHTESVIYKEDQATIQILYGVTAILVLVLAFLIFVIWKSGGIKIGR